MHSDLPERRMQCGNQKPDAAQFRHRFLILPSLQRNNSTSQRVTISLMIKEIKGQFPK
jgi:hypothetical protein